MLISSLNDNERVKAAADETVGGNNGVETSDTVVPRQI